MRFLPALRRDATSEEAQRDNQIDYTLDEWMAHVQEVIYGGNSYITTGVNQTQPGQRQEPIGPAYRSLTDLAYKSDSVVFSCMQARARHFRQVRFQYRDKKTRKLYGNVDLGPLEAPWPGATTADLLTRMILHADLGGNAFVVKRGDGVALLRPDWVTLIIGSNTDPDLGAWATDAEILGYLYSPGGYGSDSYETEAFAPEEVAHFAPIPDPEARFRGMSWLTPLMREVMADKAATEHKLSFFQNPTPNMVVKFDVPGLDEYKEQITEFKKAHLGARNAYKYMFGTMGMDFTPVGSNLKDLDYKMITGAGETRIAAAAGTPAIIVGLSEAQAGSALNSGNYQAARRQFVDGVIRDLWQDAAGSLANIVTVQSGSELWYSDKDVAFVKEDAGERAGVLQQKAQTIRYLVDAGYKPDTVIEAVEAEDFSLLEHSGLFSVQLQAANAPKQGLFSGVPVPNTEPGAPPAAPVAPSNGNGGPPRSLEAGDTHIHFDEGAFQLELPASPDVHIHEGAFRAEVTTPDVHVEAPVTFEEGSIQAHPAEVRFEEGAIRTDVASPEVTVESPKLVLEEGAIQVDVEPPSVDVTVQKGGKRRVDYGDGRTAIVTEGEARRIEFEDGRTVTVTDLEDDK